MKEFETTRGAHARFKILEKVYTNELLREEQVVSDDEQIAQH